MLARCSRMLISFVIPVMYYPSIKQFKGQLQIFQNNYICLFSLSAMKNNSTLEPIVVLQFFLEFKWVRFYIQKCLHIHC